MSRRVLRVLHLHPRRAPAGPVAARDSLRHDAFKAHAAGVTEHRLAVCALHVLAVDDRGGGLVQVLPEQGPALDEGKPAQVVEAPRSPSCSGRTRCGPHSITSSARARSVGGIVRPRAFAVLRLMISSNLLAR